MRGRLLIFCGIPGSGKTTVARRVAASVEESILVQTDGIRAMLARPSFSRAESKMVYDACFEVAKTALKAGYLVILDGTFMREDYRSEAREILRKYAVSVKTVWVDCRLETALSRNARRKAMIPPEKLKGIYTGFEPPRRGLRVDSTRLSPKAAAKRIVKTLL